MTSHISSPASQAVLSFCYAPIESYQYHMCKKEDEHTSILATLHDTCQNIMTNTNIDIQINASDKPTPLLKNTLVDTPTDYNLTLIGSLQSLTTSRSDLLLHCPFKVELVLPIPSSECPTTEQCERVAKETNTAINIIQPEPHKSCFASDHISSVVIVGTPEAVEKARVRLLVSLDEAAGLSTDIVHIPLKLQYLIGGRKRTGLHPIIEETCTNIYYPSPFTTSLTGIDEDNAAIYITGDATNVTRVEDMLNKLAAQKAKSMYHKSVIMVPQKLDWMLLHRKDEIRKIMHDNGSFVEFPVLGSGEDRISVYAENRVNAERTLRAINFVACSIYEAVFFFNNNDAAMYDAPGQHTFFDSMTNLANMVTQLSQVSGAQVIYKKDPGCIEVMGTERAIRNVYQSLQEMTFLKPFHQGTVFRVESANEQRDFISGKKNGKINKIMKTSGAKIRFLSLASDYNFIIEVDSTSFTKALDGLTLLQEELPAEISFFVPEAYHKRIIGVGGKNIQRIMKKYGVYVKFSNTEEFASLGGYYDNEDNVVARTPMKNQINLDNLRHAVMELIHPKDRDYNMRTLTIPFRQHRLLAHEKSSFFDEEIGKKTNTRILWPDCELALNEVFLVGPEAQIDMAMNMVQSVVPRNYELRAPLNDTITNLLDSDTFKQNIISRLQEYGVSLRSYPDRFYPDDFVIVLQNITLDSFPATLDLVTTFLKSQNINYYEQKSFDLCNSLKSLSIHQYMQGKKKKKIKLKLNKNENSKNE
ncbi:hypothetical protein BJ944DRAFT_164386 [Cunninghamella echinulata]|nr:hypothetical protein BJ944DRAFT_164386 [Cunninghamella echinulata]